MCKHFRVDPVMFMTKVCLGCFTGPSSFRQPARLTTPVNGTAELTHPVQFCVLVDINPFSVYPKLYFRSLRGVITSTFTVTCITEFTI